MTDPNDPRILPIARALARFEREEWIFDPPILDGQTREATAPEVYIRRATQVIAAIEAVLPVNGTTLYGHRLTLEQVDDDEMVVDVMVLARLLKPQPDGSLEDALCVNTTNTTTSMVQKGMAQTLIEIQGGWSKI